jgi:hypothetical protein
MSDVTFDMKSNSMEVHQYAEPWKVSEAWFYGRAS